MILRIIALMAYILFGSFIAYQVELSGRFGSLTTLVSYAFIVAFSVSGTLMSEFLKEYEN